jgi:hypothetical protein
MKIRFKTGIVLFSLLYFLCCNANGKKQDNLLALAETPSSAPYKQSIKVALLLDTSNSMDGLIDQAKSQLWDIVSELSYAKCGKDKPNLQIALYEYGNDNLAAAEGHIRQIIAFSTDLDEISKHLFSLNTNGGNEYCGQVIQTSLNQLSWGTNEADLKLIFIAGNEPFTQGKISYRDAAEQAKRNHVSVNTIFCGDYDQGIATSWQEGALLSNGNYMAINQNRTTTYVSTPYDDQILELNQKLNTTYVAYGSYGQKKMALQAEQDSNANGYSKENAVSRTVSKSSHLYKNSNWDLVDASNKKDFKIEDLNTSALPKALIGKSAQEIEAYIDQKKQERNSINENIQNLNEKRRSYLSEQENATDDNLENVMIKAIKTQAKAKNYTW